MRILLLQSSAYIPSLGGANKANRLLLEQLAARGHECQVIGTAGESRVESAERCLAGLAAAGVRGAATRPDDPGVVAFRHAGVTVEAVLDGARLRAHVAARLRELAPDRVLVSSEDPAQILLREAVSGGAPVVYIAHTTLHLPFGPDGFLASPAQTGLLRQTAGIIAVSDYVRGYLRDHAGLESTVLRFPVYGAGPFPALADFDRGAITLINPCAVKGIAIFLELARRCPDLRFAAVPTWGTTAADRAALAALPNLEILEPTADIDRIFARCSVLLVPSLWGEAFGQVAVEAMLRGVPVLASDAGGLPEATLGVGRILSVQPIRTYEERFDERKIPVAVVPEQDMAPWETALREILADRESYRALSAAARQAAQAFVSGLGIGPFEEYLESLSARAATGRRRMRLLLVQPLTYLFSAGGAHKANRLLLQGLAARGHVCHVVAPEGAEEAVFLHEGVEVHAVADGLDLCAETARQIRTFDPDWTIVSEDPSGEILQQVLEASPRVVYLAHSPATLPFGPAAFSADETRTSLLRRTAGILTVSHAMRDYLRRWAGLDSTVVYSPAYGSGPFPALAAFDRGHVALINPSKIKGVSIFAGLARRMPEVSFAAIPTWSTTAEDRDLLAGLPNVSLLPATDDVDELFAGIRVLVVPSLWGEAFGQVVIEALLRGVPVVTSDQGGLPEAGLGVTRIVPVRPIEHYEERLDDRRMPVPVVPEQDLDPWEAELRALLSDRAEYERLSEASRHAAARFVSGLGIEPYERFLAALSPEPAQPAPAPPAATDLQKKLSGLSPEKLELLARRLKKKEAAAPPAPEIPRLPRGGADGDRFQLSFAQQRLWFLDRLEPGSLAYNEHFAILLNGSLDPRRLASALDRIVQRHEILRTTYAEEAEEPVQIVRPLIPEGLSDNRPGGHLPLPLVDLGALPEAARAGEAARLATAESRRPFDLENGPVMRALLQRTGAEEHRLIITAHHIAVDNWSATVLFAELSALYGSLDAQTPPALPELPVQYADFAVWQRGWLSGATLDGELGFWRGQLAGAPALIDLPTDRPRPARQSFRGTRATARFSPRLAAALRGVARRQDATPYMLLLAVFQTLLHRLTGQDDLVVGTPVAGRNRREIEPLIGCFLNSLPMRARIAPGLRFPELLDQARRTALDAFAHQDLPFERLVEALAPERNLSHPPIFQVLFNFLNVPPRTEGLPGGVRLRAGTVQSGTTRFDLELYMEEQEQGLIVALVYNTDLFDAATTARLLSHLEVLLHGVAERPDEALSALPLLAPAESHQLLREWNDTAAETSERPGVHQLFATQARRTPDAPAAIFQETSLTYAELASRASQLAGHLRRLGCGPETRVAVALERCLDMPVALLGVLEAGSAYVPLDPDYPSERLALVLEDAAPRVLITRERLLSALPPVPGTVLCLDGELTPGGPSRSDGQSPFYDLQLAYTLYTSGSTGRPKGVEVPHRTLVNFLGSMRRTPGFAPGERLLAVTSLAFDIAALEIFLPLTTGGCVELASREEAADGVLLAARLHASGASVMQATPATWRMLLDSGWTGDPGLRALCGGEALPRDLAAVLAGRTRELWNLYGPTETTVWSAAARIHPEESGPVSIGRPIAETRIHLLDRALDTVPLGVPGELYISGAGLARGYLGRPDLTADRFVPDPLAAAMGTPGGRLYRTGDLARHLPGGRMEVLGRIDHQVKVRGFRIELGEIEATLTRHPGIREAVVVLREGSLVAYLVPAGEVPAAGELRDVLRKSLPEPMVPAVFVPLSALPLTPNRKVDRKALPAPGPAAATTTSFVAPRSPAEEVLAGIWSEVLGREQVGIHDNFFDLGGHSLLATRVVSRLRRVFGVELPLRILFERPTVEEMAAAAEEARRGAGAGLAQPLVPVPRTGDLPLSFAQERLWFLHRLEPGSAAYSLPVACRLSGPLEARALAAAHGEILRRHEALRTTFPEVAGQPVQRIAPQAAVSMPVIDLAGLPEAPRLALAERLMAEEARRPFDLGRGPLARLTLLRLDPEEHLALLNMHHIVADGWSMGVLIRELTALYTAGVQEAPSPLPELPVQYADYAVWQRGRLRGEALATQLAWWREQLAGAPPFLELPFDRGAPVPGRRAGQVEVGLSAEQAAALEALSRRQGATLFMTLLAGWSALLSRYTTQEDLLVGSPIANRTRLETEGLIGFFVNTLVLRTDLSGDPGFDELTARVRRTTLDAYDHQELPFERLVQELQPERHLARSPLFQVFFALQNAPRSAFELPDLRLELLPVPLEGSKFDLSLVLERRETGLFGTLEYRRDLCDAATAARLLEHWRNLLDGALAAPETRLAELPLLSAAERDQLLADWGNGGPAGQGGGTIPALFAAQVARSPQATAVVGAGESLTYGELASRARGVAERLHTLGIGPESTVGVCLGRSPDLIVAILGVLEAGAAYVPLDPAYPAERLAFMLADSGAAVVLTDGASLPRLPDGVAQVLQVDAAPLHGGKGTPPDPAGPGNLAYLIYTSGSTGRPKGVAIEHASAAAFVRWAGEVFGAELAAGVLASTSICFDLSVFEIFATLCHGGRVILVENALELATRAAAGEVGLINTVPSALAELLRRGAVPGSVRTVNLAGEALPGRLVRQIHDETAVERVFNLYGPSEDTTYSLFAQVGRDEATPPIGRPVAGTRACVLGPRGDLLPAGVPGELLLGGDGLARGYLGRPDLTAERFVPDPWAPRPGGRLYRTGDLVRFRRDGVLEFLGRIDQQVKIRGFRIEPGEVEAALLQHPRVREAVVVARETAGSRSLVAYLACEAGQPTARELRESLRERLPEHMIPSAFIHLAALPRTPNGKVDRRALPRPERAAGREVPRSEVERRIAAIWRELLDVEEIGVDDNFFDLGGHSLLLSRVQSRLIDELGRGVEMVDLFAQPTVRSLARFFTREAGGALPETLPSRRAPLDGNGAVAVIGMAGRFPGAGDLERLWRNLCDGVEMISFFSEEELAAAGVPRAALADPSYVRAGGVLEGADLFDAEMFGVPPREAEIIDPQQRVLLECAWEALEQAGYAGTRHRVGVFAGTSMNTYLLHNIASRPDVVSTGSMMAVALASAPDFAATRLSYKLGLSGPGVTVQTACSTSLVAIHLACQSLLAGDCEIALAGGASVSATPVSGYLYQPGGILSPDGHCRAFDARAQGTVGGQGVGVVVLKRLDEAVAAGDTIRAVILGSAINNDGSTKAGFTAPSPEGQAAAIREAHLRSGVDPASISYVEAHGTATALGDPIEVAALTRAFGPDLDSTSCALGSIKTNIGHLDAAAGVAGFVKAVLAVERGTIPPSLHFEEPNPEIDFASGPFYVNARCSPWPEGQRPRRAGVSSFGLGGTNAHAVLEEPPPAAPSGPSRPWQVLTLSARSSAALERATDDLAASLEGSPASLADVAHTLWVGRRAFGERRAVLASSTQEAAAALASRDPRRTWIATCAEGDRPIAFLLPGVGEQYMGMAAGLYASEPVFRREIDTCAELLAPHLGLDLRELIAHSTGAARGAEPSLRDLLRPRVEADGPIHRTEVAQPAMFAVGWALARLWMSWGIRPSALLGYSLGEYTAACLAGVMTLEDGLALVARRARLISDLPAGGMMAVPLPEGELRSLLGGGLSVATVNGPAVSVVAGPLPELAALEERLAEAGLPCRRLRTSHAFHSRSMEPIAGPLRDLLRGIELRAPRLPYLSNVTGTWIQPGQAVDPAYWEAHLLGTVRFADAIAELWREPRRILLELGPGSSLGSLALQQLPDEPGDRLALPSLRHELERQDDQELLLSTLARLWTAGVEIDGELLYAGERRRRVPLPTYPFERQRFWLERGQAPAPVAPEPTADRIPDPADWFHAPTWRRSPPMAAPRRGAARRWLFLFDEHGLGESLAARLQAAGHEVVGVHPGRNRDIERLLAGMDEMPEEIVHAWTLSSPAEGTSVQDRFDAAQEAGFYSLIALARALAGRLAGRKVRISVLTNGLCQVERSDDLQPEKATLQGPLKVIPQEHPEIACRALDVDLREAGPRLEERLLAELERDDNEPLVALRGPHRWVPDFTAVRLEAETGAPLPLRDQGVYLVTGGLGGIGLALAGWLARTFRARLALVGRTPLPEHAAPSDTEETVRRLREVEALRAAGAEVLVLAADVADEEAMRQAVTRIRQRFGRIDGVFHAAGVPGGGLVQLKSREAADRVLAPKTRGALVLESALRDDPPSLVVFFSSINAVTGGIGQVDYSAAHAFLDALANHRTACGEHTVAVDWCAWRWDRWTGAGVSDPRVLAELRRQREIYGLSFEEGMEGLRRILASGLPQVVVSTRGLRKEIEQSHSLSEVLEGLAKVPERPRVDGRQRPRTGGTAYVAPRSSTEARIAGVWQELLGFEPIGVHDNFFQLGGSSLLGLEVAWRLNRELGVEVPLQALFEAPTVAELSALLEPGEAPASAPAPEIRVRPRGEELLARLDDLSDEEMEDLLATMMAEEGEGVQS